ncbi:MAG: protein kinase [Candidatus Acidiferrales bacterium]
MTPEGWQEIKKVLAEALERTPEQRPAYLDQACPEPDKRREVESLLRADKQAQQNFLSGAALAPGEELAAGRTLGVYEIVARIGAGGMGDVYHARDTKLGRSVAIKVLPPAFVEDPERFLRFQREARILASLNHPNIATIHGFEQSGDTQFLVMELVPGKTLAERLKTGPLEIPEALAIAQQICGALESAHEQGIIHRDLKPANVAVTPDGRVKVLDFGLAKMLTSGPDLDAESSPTAAAESLPGTILGTPAYMSPEQARGKAVDKRADIWAFGCVLYEMLSGQRSFGGESTSDVLAAVLTKEPDWTSLPKTTPPAMQKLLRRCLVSEPKQRLRDIGDARIAIEDVQSGGGDAGPSVGAAQADAGKKQSLVKRWRWAAPLTLAILILAAVLAFLFRPTHPPRVTASRQVSSDGRGKLRMVTDGSRIYFSATSGFSYSLNEVSIAGGATVPIQTSVESPIVTDISPDRSELLVLNCQIPIDWDCPLFALPMLGQSPRHIGDIRASDATWSPGGKELVYAEGNTVYRVSVDGSESRKIVSLAAGSHAFWPRWSPDGSRLRFTVLADTHQGELWEVSADGSNLHPLLLGGHQPTSECCGSWTPNGKYFLFTSQRSGVNNIWAIRDQKGAFQKPGNEPVQLTTGPTPTSSPLVSPDGKKVFVITAQIRGELVRYNLTSHQFSPYLSGISAINVNFSADRKWVVYTQYPENTLWRSNVDGSQRVQLTFPPLTVLQPRCSPDGTLVAFMGHEPGKPFSVYVIPSEGGSAQQPVPGNHLGADPNWSPDGNRLLFGRYAAEVAPGEGTLDLEILNLRTHEISKVPGSEGLWAPRWSRDGNILALQREKGWLMLFDAATQQWSPLVKMVVDWPEWSHQGDSVYFYGAAAGGQQGVYRVRIRDHKLELLFNLNDFRQPPDFGWGSWKGLAPDDSPLLLRDAGAQDIYSLDIDFP